MLQNYDQLGRRNALNITRLSLTSLFSLTVTARSACAAWSMVRY
jgi:hypothetical protein